MQGSVDTIIAIVAELLPETSSLRERLGPEVSLDRDLGLDSLTRMELIRRVESACGVTLPEERIAELNTPAALWEAVLAARHGVLGGFARVAPVAPGIVTAPANAATLLDMLHWHGARHRARPFVTFFQDEGEGATLTFGDILEHASDVAAGLQAQGLEPGQRVALMLPTSEAYFSAFFGTLLAGGVPVPIYPPVRPSEIEDHMRRQAAILVNAGATLLITVPEARTLARLTRALVPSLRRIVSVEELSGTGQRLQQPAVQPDDIAFLQYTSGSTGLPKGVVLSHANLLNNVRMASQAVAATSEDVFVSWLPLYHDMGLIGAVLASHYNGMRLVLMSPLKFLTRPQRWLWAIHRHRGTLSAAPNFAYELCVAKIDDAAIAGLDLGSWRLAFNGAEAISATTLTSFSQRFAPFGFRPQTMYPVYGLAENSVALAFPAPGSTPRIDTVRREPLMSSGLALPADDGDPTALQFVACGNAIPEHELRVVDAAGVELGEREQGHIQFRGPSATRGYFGNPEATKRLFRGGWLETGDLGYLAEGGLHVTGRHKDIVIRRGRNVYPDEIEHDVGEIEGIRRGRVAVFGSADPATASERLVVVAECRTGTSEDRVRIVADINQICSALAGSPPDVTVLVAAGTILKTSSGKLRRSACKSLYEEGQLERGAPAPWRQLWRLGLSAAPGLTLRLRRDLGLWAYNIWTWGGFYLVRVLLWLGLLVWPGRRGRWWLTRAAARSVMQLARVPLSVQHAERLGDGTHPCVVVANHTSFIDALLLAALVPWPARFVAMRELSDNRLTRGFYERVGALFVERFDLRESVRDAGVVAERLAAGESLLVFPEGRMALIPQLQPFLMGAFLAAVRAGTPVVPVTLIGADRVMKGDRRLIRRAPITIHVGEPILPPDDAVDEWAAASALRDATRAAIEARLALPEQL